MKRKPPAKNVRRVCAIDGNMRYSIVNKCLHTVQCESFQEYKLVLLLERNPHVTDYVSQPEQLTSRQTNGREINYTPDFQVWYQDETIALHEVTIQERRSKITQIQRELLAQTICQERGWQYVVHTETSLPTGAQLANLQLLFGFRACGMLDPYIEQNLHALLSQHEKRLLFEIVTWLTQDTGRSSSEIMPTILHLVWHSKLQINWQQLLCRDASPHPAAYIWMEV